jgi:hypothetical protein
MAATFRARFHHASASCSFGCAWNGATPSSEPWVQTGRLPCVDLGGCAPLSLAKRFTALALPASPPTRSPRASLTQACVSALTFTYIGPTFKSQGCNHTANAYDKHAYYESALHQLGRQHARGHLSSGPHCTLLAANRPASTQGAERDPGVCGHQATGCSPGSSSSPARPRTHSRQSGDGQQHEGRAARQDGGNH